MVVAGAALVAVRGSRHDLDRDALRYAFGKIDIVDPSAQRRSAHFLRGRCVGTVENHFAARNTAIAVPPLHIIATEDS